MDHKQENTYLLAFTYFTFVIPTLKSTNSVVKKSQTDLVMSVTQRLLLDNMSQLHARPVATKPLSVLSRAKVCFLQMNSGKVSYIYKLHSLSETAFVFMVWFSNSRL